ncbi:MAG: hypothetical protein QXS20_04390 [Candidatus Thorarchaeota archaeon]
MSGPERFLSVDGMDDTDAQSASVVLLGTVLRMSREESDDHHRTTRSSCRSYVPQVVGCVLNMRRAEAFGSRLKSLVVPRQETRGPLYRPAVGPMTAASHLSVPSLEQHDGSHATRPLVCEEPGNRVNATTSRSESEKRAGTGLVWLRIHTADKMTFCLRPGRHVPRCNIGVLSCTSHGPVLVSEVDLNDLGVQQMMTEPPEVGSR